MTRTWFREIPGSKWHADGPWGTSCGYRPHRRLQRFRNASPPIEDGCVVCEECAYFAGVVVSDRVRAYAAAVAWLAWRAEARHTEPPALPSTGPLRLLEGELTEPLPTQGGVPGSCYLPGTPPEGIAAAGLIGPG